MKAVLYFVFSREVEALGRELGSIITSYTDLGIIPIQPFVMVPATCLKNKQQCGWGGNRWFPEFKHSKIFTKNGPNSEAK